LWEGRCMDLLESVVVKGHGLVGHVEAVAVCCAAEGELVPADTLNNRDRFM
jgi:hypothetical protein